MRSRGFLALAGVVMCGLWGAGLASAKPLHIDYPIAHSTQPPTTAQCEAMYQIACYSPLQLEQAYDMNPLYRSGLTGRGKTIVLVDSFGSPTIAQDLATFDRTYGLPAPPSFKIIQPDGPVNDNLNVSDDASWGIETSLDVEYSHAMAPGANIVLVETPVDETEGIVGIPQIVEAENYVIDHHLGDVISQSFGATEQTFSSPQQIYGQRSAYLNAFFHHVTVLAASGDYGATDYEDNLSGLYPFRVSDWPSTDPLVTSVGGTQLHLNAAGYRVAPDNVWNDEALLGAPIAGSGGLSTVFTRPSYQDGVANVVGRQRGVPDVAMSAAVNGAALVYWSFDSATSGNGPNGWQPVGGTSEATPLFSGVVAVADQAAGHDLGLLNPALYAHGDGPGSGLVDILTGNNTVSFTNAPTDPYPGPHTVVGFNAGPGYDLASGLGTADGAKLVAELAHGGPSGYHRR